MTAKDLISAASAATSPRVIFVLLALTSFKLGASFNSRNAWAEMGVELSDNVRSAGMSLTSAMASPPGNYQLTFMWFDRSVVRIGGGDPQDMFNGKYSDPDKSEFVVEVEGTPVEVPTIELTTKDVPEAQPGVPALRRWVASGSAGPKQSGSFIDAALRAQVKS